MKAKILLMVKRLFNLSFILTCIFIIILNKAIASNENNYPGVEYATLTASANDKGVFINWTTISEQNNSHFEVERSTDTRSFKTVALILDGFSATGTSGKIYKFKEAPGLLSKNKTVYYRLKQIDNNNQVHYSELMPVQMNATVYVFPKKGDLLVNTSKINSYYCGKQAFLSKQSIVVMADIQIPVAVSTTGLISSSEFIMGNESLLPQLCTENKRNKLIS